MILSNVAIHEALDSRRLLIDPNPKPRDPMALDCPYQTSAVDLRLSNEISVYQRGKTPVHIDLRSGGFAKLGASVMEPRQLTEDQPFVLEPNRFILGRTLERVELPLSAEANNSLAARVEGKALTHDVECLCTSQLLPFTLDSKGPSPLRSSTSVSIRSLCIQGCPFAN